MFQTSNSGYHAVTEAVACEAAACADRYAEWAGSSEEAVNGICDADEVSAREPE